MGLFGDKPRSSRTDTSRESAVDSAAPIRADAPRPARGEASGAAEGKNSSPDGGPRNPPLSLWTDSLGKLAIRGLQIIVVVTLAWGIIWGLRQVTVVVIPLLIALILACAFYPLVAWLRHRGVPSAVATLLTFLLILLLLGGVGWLIVWAVRNQFDDLYSQAQDGIQQVIDWVNTLPFAPDQAQLDEWLTQLQDYATSSQFGTGALAGVSFVATFLTGLILMIFVLFFFLKDGPRLWAFLRRPFQGKNDARARRIGDATVDTLGSYVRGTAIVALVDAVGIGIGLLILQVPLALPLAVLVFLLAFIPIVGATVAGILAALVALVANGPVSALLVIGVVVLVNQLEGNLLQPVIMGRTLKLHPFVILVALTAGAVIGGILGAVLAVPITAVAWHAVLVWDGPHTPARWARKKEDESVE